MDKKRVGEPIPEYSRHCMSCDGSGKSSLDKGKKCKICRGKGYWNQEDMLLYHKDCTRKSCLGSKYYGCTVKSFQEEEHKDLRRIKKLEENIKRLNRRELREVKKKGKR